MEDGLTQAERTIAADGGEDTVRSVRRAYRDAVHDELVGVVESLTGRHVLALLCDQSVSPDLSTEVFVLDARSRSASTFSPRRGSAGVSSWWWMLLISRRARERGVCPCCSQPAGRMVIPL